MSYSQLTRLLDNLAAGFSASTMQGQVAALSCLGLSIPEHWPRLNTPVFEATGDLKTWAEYTQRQIQTDDVEFALLLPDEHRPLTERIECLREFCQAFADTLAYAVSNDLASVEQLTVDREPGEILRDIMEISKITSAVEGEDEDERDFMELTEYLRVAVRVFALNYPSTPS